MDLLIPFAVPIKTVVSLIAITEKALWLRLLSLPNLPATGCNEKFRVSCGEIESSLSGGITTLFHL